jgi:hypothetical protein
VNADPAYLRFAVFVLGSAGNVTVSMDSSLSQPNPARSPYPLAEASFAGLR